MTGHQDHFFSKNVKAMVIYATENNKVSQFQVGYISFPGLNQHKIFRYHVLRSMATKLTGDTIKSTRKTLGANNKFVISLLISNED